MSNVEETPAAQRPEEAFAEAASIGELGISVIKVVDPRTFVVGPNAYEQEHSGLSGEITADIRADADLLTPAETECGYDEALAFATQYFAANPDDAYMREGDFVSDGCYENLLRGGFGYIPNNQGIFAVPQADAELNKSGLHLSGLRQRPIVNTSIPLKHPPNYPWKEMMTMTDEISIKNTKSPKYGKKHIALLTAGVLILAGGITAASVSVANANAQETARQCTVALTDGAKATKAAKASIATADEALEAVKSVTLPGDAGISTDYAGRPAVEAIEAVEAVPAVEASEGVEAVPAVVAVGAVPARASGADLIIIVSDDSAALAKIKIPSECVERDEAAAITALVATSKTAASALDTSSEAVLADFAVFQTEEAARIAAEIEAARVAAEAEAARRAAEEAARQEAARQNSGGGTKKSSGGGGYTKPPSGGGGGSYTPPAPKPPSGGGQVGPGGGGGVCWTSNGAGGLKPC